MQQRRVEGLRPRHTRARGSDPAISTQWRDQQRVCGVRGRQHDLDVRESRCHQLADVVLFG